MKKNMQKILVLFLVIVMLSLTACSSPTNTPADTTAPAVTAPPADVPEKPESLLGTKDVTINFWHCASDEAGVLMDKYIKEFNETNEYGITVNAIYQGQYSDATTLLKTILSAENYSELPDVMQMDATGKVPYFNSTKAYTVDAALADHPDDAFLSNYLTVAMGNWQFSGAQLGLPFATSTSVTYYNKNLLTQAGWDKAPDTFADVVALYNDMQAAGMAQKVLQSVPNSPSLTNWIGQLGSYVVDQSNGTGGNASKLVCIENGTLAKFLTEWKAMYDAGAILNEDASIDLFIAGDVALLANSSSNIAPIIEKVGGAFEVGVSNYLRVSSDAAYGATVSGSCVAMFDSGDALRKEASWYFMQYLTSGDVQADFAANTGYIPANVAALEKDVYKNVTVEYPQYAVAYEQLTNTPADMRSITVGPSKDFYYAIMQCSSDMLEQNQTVEETVGIMADELNNLLAEYARSNP
ncbi:MAG: extracellular solute-binding protein [Bacillota bacterium]